MSRLSKTFIQVGIAIIVLILVYTIPRMGKQNNNQKAEENLIYNRGKEVFSLDTSQVYQLNKIHGLYTKINKYGGYPSGCLEYLKNLKINIDTGTVYRKKKGNYFVTIEEDTKSISVKYGVWQLDQKKYDIKTILK